MNVRELIETLHQYNPDDMVVVAGYEGGVDEVKRVEATHLKLNQNTEWYYGAHKQEASAATADCAAVLIS